MPTDVILDCDPGHDDAIALLMGSQSDAINLRAVTTVAGNHVIEKTTRNALSVLTLAGRTDIPVARGMSGPLVREQVIADYVHGESGLDGTDLPEPTTEPIEEHAVDTLIEEARKRDGATLVPVGPLSNVAVALRKAPDLEDELERIVLMGGAIADGNITPAAEFNVFADPEAAHIVFESDIPVTMVGLDATRKARLDREQIDAIRERGSAVASAVADLLEYTVRFHEEEFGWTAVPVHDACAIAAVIAPGILETERMHVGIETRGELTYGRTVADVRGVTDNEPSVDVVLDIDSEAFFEMLISAIERY
ncbi:MAG TPA: nucleoside hydrolase [Halococcus sp.]|nr:nucleoside hydrolase [Halococcus sp.]